MKTCECGGIINEEGICEECGLIDDEYEYLRQYREYPFDPDRKGYHYGDARTHSISDISVMTVVNPKETSDANLKRILKWNTNYEWSIIKSEIIISNIKLVSSQLGLDRDFTERCLYFFRKIKDKTVFTGKLLETSAQALVYTVARLDGLPYSLYDFKQAGFDSHQIYRYYIEFIKQWKLINLVKPQDIRLFVSRFINSLLPDDPITYRHKFELTSYCIDIFTYFINLFNPRVCAEDLATDCTMMVNNSGLPLLGAIVYSACKKHPDFKISQKDVANAAGVTEVTIRNYLKQIKNSIA